MTWSNPDAVGSLARHVGMIAEWIVERDGTAEQVAALRMRRARGPL